MPQISKHIPIQGHAGFPSVLGLQEYAMLEGKVNVFSYTGLVAFNSTARYFWRTTGSASLMFNLNVTAVSQAGAITYATIFQMDSVNTPDVWVTMPKNMNRMFPVSADIEVGTYVSEGSSPTQIYYFTPGNGLINGNTWFNADISKYYGLRFTNNDSSNNVYFSFQVYLIEGIN